MKVLQAVSLFYPALTFGGAVKVSYAMSKELVKMGHEVTVFTTDAYNRETRFNPAGDYSIIDGIHVKYFENKLYKPKNNIFLAPELARAVKKEISKFDIIHVHEYRSYLSLVVTYYANKYAIPYVLQAHGSLPRIMAKQRLKLIYDVTFGYRQLKDASKVIALSQREAEQYCYMGVPEEKIVIIPNGIDLSEYADLPMRGIFKKKFRIGEEEKIILYLGRIHESKGLDLLVKAFNLVLKEIKNSKLVVVGPDDGYASILSKLISTLGIEDRVLFTGFVEKRIKLAALVDADVFITPRFHGFPMTFLEACVAECPIVTTTSELDWINESIGYVIENSPRALAQATSKILLDDLIQKKFKINCRNLINNFHISTVASCLEDTYNSILKKSIS